MKTTTTREYDAQGHLVRETTVTENGAPPNGDAWRWDEPRWHPATPCTCGPWNGIMPPPPCPAHGQAFPAVITCGTNTPQLAR